MESVKALEIGQEWKLFAFIRAQEGNIEESGEVGNSMRFKWLIFSFVFSKSFSFVRQLLLISPLFLVSNGYFELKTVWICHDREFDRTSSWIDYVNGASLWVHFTNERWGCDQSRATITTAIAESKRRTLGADEGLDTILIMEFISNELSLQTTPGTSSF